MNRVLLLGVPRSGTTWVGEALGRSRGAVYVHEPDGVTEPFAFRAQWLDGLTHYPVLRAEDRAVELSRLWDGAFAGGRRAGNLRDKIARRAYRRVRDVDKVRARSAGRLTLDMRVAEMSAVPRVPDAGAQAVVVKSVNSAFCAEWLYERWHPRVVVIQRDFRNVMASWFALGFGGTIPSVYATARREAERRWAIQLPEFDDPVVRSIAFCAVMTLALNDDLCRHSEWIGIEHEALCIDSATRLAEIAARLGLEWTELANDYVRVSDRPGEGYATARLASDLPDQWKRRLNREQQDAIAAVVARFPPELWPTDLHS